MFVIWETKRIIQLFRWCKSRKKCVKHSFDNFHNFVFRSSPSTLSQQAAIRLEDSTWLFSSCGALLNRNFRSTIVHRPELVSNSWCQRTGSIFYSTIYKRSMRYAENASEKSQKNKKKFLRFHAKVCRYKRVEYPTLAYTHTVAIWSSNRIGLVKIGFHFSL